MQGQACQAPPRTCKRPPWTRLHGLDSTHAQLSCERTALLALLLQWLKCGIGRGKLGLFQRSYQLCFARPDPQGQSAMAQTFKAA
eukprot:4064485-Alexandrium_andersonii.AAC.1